MIFSLISIFGIAVLLSRRINIPFFYAPIAVVSIFTCLGFVFALVHIFNIFIILFLFLGMTSLLFELILELRHKSSNKQFYIDILIFWTLSLALMLYLKGAVLYGWDEYFWGEYAKVLFYSNGFWDKATPILGNCVNLNKATVHSTYIPGFAVLQNIFIYPIRKFSENAMYFGNAFILLCISLLLFQILRRHISKINCAHWACVPVFFVLPQTLILSYTYLMVDQYIGIVFSAAFMLLVFESDKRISRLLLFVMLPFLAILKLNTLPLCLVVVTGVVLLKLFDGSDFDLKKTKQCIFLVFRFMLLPMILCFLWLMYLKAYDLITVDVSNKAFVSAFELIKKGELSIRVPLHYFIKNIFTIPTLTRFILSGNIAVLTSVFALMLFYTSIILICLSKSLLPKKITLLLLGLISLGFLGWIATHLYIWLFIMNSLAGTRFSSFARFLSTYMLAFALFAYLLFILSRKTKIGWIMLIIFNIVLVIYISPIKFISQFKSPVVGTIMGLNDASDFLKANTPPGSRIWTIAQNSNGIETMQMRYLLFPERSTGRPHYYQSLGNPYYPGDADTQDISSNEMKRIVKDWKIKYIFLLRYDKQFTDRFGNVLNLGKYKDLTVPVLLDVSMWMEKPGEKPRIISEYHAPL